MHRFVAALAVVVVLLAGCDFDGAVGGQADAVAVQPVDAAVAELMVAAETDVGYDRAVFGDYDRDRVIAASAERWSDCAGYYSAADDRCHFDAGAVHVDHIVSLSEAWDSGASEWTTVQLDGFPSDRGNLWLLTSELNLAKTDGDAAEWLPPHELAVCGYVAAYVAVKAEWGLSVDVVERDALAAAAAGCAATGPAAAS